MVSHVDTRVTISAVRSKLSSLDGIMRDFISDIEKFNEHAVELLEKLSACGEESQDLLVNLFKGYKQCKDPEFVDCTKKKEDSYEEGRDVTYQQLIDWVVNKFKPVSTSSFGFTFNLSNLKLKPSLILSTVSRFDLSFSLFCIIASCKS